MTDTTFAVLRTRESLNYAQEYDRIAGEVLRLQQSQGQLRGLRLLGLSDAKCLEELKQKLTVEV
jgi:hypothetical protein